MKILNLYAGIGGYRKLWGEEHEITAVEWDEKIANIYKTLFPKDKMIVTDAHQYLLEHFEEFDFIWSSPPCPTHSMIRFLKKEQNAKNVFPDMKLYEEIILLKYWFKNKYCIENVVSYYEPLIIPYKCENHYFWSNFRITNKKSTNRGLIRITMDNRIKFMEENYDIKLDSFNISKGMRSQVLSNCVNPEIGLHILNCMLSPGIMIKAKGKYFKTHIKPFF